MSQKLNKYMHPRNIYRTPPSFKKLALKFPNFRKYCTYDPSGKVHLDFKDANAIRELTITLLDQDFGLQVSIPDGRLVPTLPLRLNYLLWLEDLIALSRKTISKKDIIGLDIGTGSVCIYPLLAAKRFGWKMIATETDDINFKSAEKNIENNKLQENILLFKVNDGDKITDITEKCRDFVKLTDNINLNDCETLKVASTDKLSTNGNSSKANLEKLKDEYLIDFVMCNPPFFSSDEEANSQNKSKKQRPSPSSMSTGSTVEKVIEGGEVKFISEIMEESVLLKKQIRIFSSMVGAKFHIKALKQKLKEIEPKHILITEFCQGKTMRWGIAWTFDPDLPLECILSKKQKVSQKPLIFFIPRSFVSEYMVYAVQQMVETWLKELKIKPKLTKVSQLFISSTLKAYKATWQNQRRIRREMKKVNESAFEVPVNESSFEDNTCIDQISEVQHICGEEQPVEDISENSNSTCQKREAESLVRLSKKIKLEDSSEKVNKDICKMPKCLLHCSLHVKQFHSQISLEFHYIGGSGGKDAMNQLLQYIKNKFSRFK